MKKILLVLVLIVCSNIETNAQYSAELYVSGIQTPWGMDWLPSGDMLVTDRSGELYIIKDGVADEVTISGLPDDIYAQRQGGLLDVKVHPDYENSGWIYFSYSSSKGDAEGANTAVIRAKLEGKNLKNIETIYKGSPNTTSGVHYGSRIEFDNEGYLFFSIGDRGNRNGNPQDITKDGGKIYRLMADGSIPSDNPFVNETSAKKAVYSYGHRNPQGMEMNPATGQIWAHEHGPRGGDELNIIKSGKNYGWPLISYGINYNGTPFAEDTVRTGMEQPATYWDPSIAPSGMTFVTSDRYPEWKGHVLVGSLKFAQLQMVKLDGNNVVGREIVVDGIGRVRSVKQGPDGIIYVGIVGEGIYKVVAE